MLIDTNAITALASEAVLFESVGSDALELFNLGRSFSPTPSDDTLDLREANCKSEGNSQLGRHKPKC